MKKILIFLFVIIACPAHGQEFSKVFYNENWEMTSMRYAKYYRNSGFNKDKLVFDSLVFDHYADGKIEMTGRYSQGLKQGDFVYYYPDNSIRLICCYKNNIRTGVWSSYFPDGTLYRSVDYNGKKEKLLALNDEKGNSILKNLSGKYLMEFFYNYDLNCYSDTKISNKSEKLLAEGSLKKGYKNGTWTIKRIVKATSPAEKGENKDWEMPETIYKFIFSNGDFINGYFYQSGGVIRELHSDSLLWLINEPCKIKVTENLLTSPERFIRQNYIIDAIQAKNRELKRAPDTEQK
jgi:antitoxin component YwqK of YwqJK toxin-antitoxin module